jgi:hypothetical protein
LVDREIQQKPMTDEMQYVRTLSWSGGGLHM